MDDEIGGIGPMRAAKITSAWADQKVIREIMGSIKILGVGTTIRYSSRMPDAPATVAYRLKVSLRHISPMIWRRLLAPSDLTLYGLHRSVQIAFG